MSLLKRFQNKFKLLAHSGWAYQCPFCLYRARDFEVVGHDVPVLREKQVVGGGRRAAGCWKCRSRDRERLLFAFLFKELQIDQNQAQRILHIAPEPRVSKILKNQDFSEYICGDLHTEGYKYPEHVRNMNVLDLDFPEKYFDLVICNHVLEHIPEDGKAMSEIYRVLKDGGSAILQVPFSKNSALTHEDFTITDKHSRKELFGQFDHVRIYGQDYINRLENAGFKVTRKNVSQKYKKFGVNPEEDIFYCEKQQF